MMSSDELTTKLRLIFFFSLPVGHHPQHFPVSVHRDQHGSQRLVHLTAFGKTGVQRWPWTDGVTTYAEIHCRFPAFVCLFFSGGQELSVDNVHFLQPTGRRHEDGAVRVSGSEHAVASLRPLEGVQVFLTMLVLMDSQSGLLGWIYSAQEPPLNWCRTL